MVLISGPTVFRSILINIDQFQLTSNVDNMVMQSIIHGSSNSSKTHSPEEVARHPRMSC